MDDPWEMLLYYIRMGVLVAIVLALLLSGCSVALQDRGEELSLILIQEIDQLELKTKLMAQQGLIDPPNRDWIDRWGGYYIGLNTAWAYGDEEEYEYFASKLLELFQELLDGAELPLVPPTKFDIPL